MKPKWIERQKEAGAVLFLAVLIWASIENGDAWMSAAWAGLAGLFIGMRIGAQGDWTQEPRERNAPDIEEV